MSKRIKLLLICCIKMLELNFRNNRPKTSDNKKTFINPSSNIRPICVSTYKVSQFFNKMDLPTFQFFWSPFHNNLDLRRRLIGLDLVMRISFLLGVLRDLLLMDLFPRQHLDYIKFKKECQLIFFDKKRKIEK